MSVHDTLNTVRAADVSLQNTVKPTSANSEPDVLKKSAAQIMTLHKAVTLAATHSPDWTRHEYICTSLVDAIKSEPALGELLTQRSGVPLLKSGEPVPLDSLHLTEAEKDALRMAIDSIELEVRTDDIKAPSGENSSDAVAAQKYVAFTEELEQFIRQSGAEIMEKVLHSWAGQIDMLQEFRSLGTNKEHVTVDFGHIDRLSTQMAGLEKSTHAGVGTAAKALKGFIDVLSPNLAGATVPLENGEQKMNTREALLGVSGLAAALQSAEAALTEKATWSGSEKAEQTHQAAGVYSALNAASMALKQASDGMNGTIKTLGQMSHFDWLMDFRPILDKHHKPLKAACKDIQATLMQAKGELTRSAALQSSMLEKTEKALAVTGSVPVPSEASGRLAEAQYAIRSAADALTEICYDVRMANIHVKEKTDRIRLNEAAASVYEMSAVLTDMEAELPGAAEFLHNGGNPNLAEFTADKLQKLIERAEKAVESLSKKSSTLKTGSVHDTDTSMDFKDIAASTTYHKAKLEKAIRRFKDVKHGLRPEINPGELMVKKTIQLSQYLDQKASAIGSAVKTFSSTTASYAGARILSTGQKSRSYPEQKIVRDNLIKLEVRRMMDSVELCNRKMAELTLAVKSKKAFGTKRFKDALAKTKRNLGATKAAQKVDKKTQQLAGLEHKFPETLKVLESCAAQADKALAGLREIEKQYPHPLNLAKTASLSKRINDTVSWVEKSTSSLKQAMGKLNLPVALPEGNGADVVLVRHQLESIQVAMTDGLTMAKTLGAGVADGLNKAQQGLASAQTCLEKAVPDIGGALSALEQLEAGLNAAKGSTGEKIIHSPITVALEKLTEVEDITAVWRTKKVSQQHAMPDSDGFDDFVNVTQRIAGEATTQVKDYQYAFTHVTQNYVNPMSTDARIMKHIAEFLNEQRDEIAEEDRELYDQTINMVIDTMKDEFKKPSDPEGDFFAAGLKEEYRRARGGEQVKAKTAEEVLQEYRSLPEYVIKGGVKGLQGQALYALLTGSVDGVLNTTLPVVGGLRIALKLGMLSFTLVKANSKLNETTMPGKPLREGIKGDLMQQEISKTLLSTLMTSVIPVGKTAIRAALTGAHIYTEGLSDVLKEAADKLPSDLMFITPVAGGVHGINAKVNALNLKAENIKAKIRQCAPEKRAELIKTYDITRPEVQKAFADIAQELKEEDKTVLKRFKRNTPMVRTQTSQDIPISDGRRSDDIRGEEVAADFEHFEALDDAEIAGEGAELTVTEINVTDEDIEESVEEALESTFNPPEDKKGVITDPQKWIDEYNHNTLTSKGIPPNSGESFDWDDRIQVYKTEDAEFSRMNGHYVPPDELLGTITFREYSMGVHLRKGWGDKRNFKLVPEYNTASARKILKALEKTNLQNDYIAAISDYYGKPEIKDMANKVNAAKLKMAVSEHSKYSISPVGYNLKEIQAKIERGEVKTFKLDGYNAANVACIKTDNNGGHIFVSLNDGKVYEVKFDSEHNSIKFKNKDEALSFHAQLRSGLSVYNMKVSGAVRVKDDGTVDNLARMSDAPTHKVSAFVEWITGSQRRIDLVDSGGSFQDRLYNHTITNLKQDIDFAIKSPEEANADEWIDLIGKVGTIIGVYALPFAGTGVGAGVSLGAKVLSVLARPGFSFALTLGSGVLPKFGQAEFADRPGEAQTQMIDGWMSLLAEFGGYELGKVSVDTLGKLAKKFAVTTEQLSDKTRKRVTDWINARKSNYLKRIGSDDISVSSKQTTSSVISADSNRSFGSGPKYDHFKFIDDVEVVNKVPDSHFKKIAGNFTQELGKFEKRFGSLSRAGLQNEMKYRTMVKLLEDKGYQVKVGFVSVTNEAGVTSKNIVLKASRPGYEDGYVYFKNNVQDEAIEGTGVAFNEEHGAKVFNKEKFEDNYITEMGLGEDYVKIRWVDNFVDPGSSVPASDLINKPDWLKKKSLESLESKMTTCSNSQSKIETESADGTIAEAVKGVAANDSSVYFFGTTVGNQLKSEDNDSFSFKNLKSQVDATDPAVRFSDAPEGTILIGTSTHLVGPSEQNDAENVRVYSVAKGRTNTSMLPYNANTNVATASGDALKSKEVSYDAANERIKTGQRQANDHLLHKHGKRIQVTLGGTVNVSGLNAPVILVLDKSKIPGYRPGRPISGDIPKNAIIGVIAEADKVEEVESYFEQITGRKIPVSAIEVENTPGVYVTGTGENWRSIAEKNAHKYPGRTHDEIAKILQLANPDITTASPLLTDSPPVKTKIITPAVESHVKPVAFVRTVAGDTWDSVVETNSSRYPNKTKAEVLTLIQAANPNVFATTESSTAPLPLRTLLAMPEIENEASVSNGFHIIPDGGEDWEQIGQSELVYFPGSDVDTVIEHIRQANPDIADLYAYRTDTLPGGLKLNVPAGLAQGPRSS
ncbi:hypothetical protein [Pantoea cypripedii]|uniref:Tox-PLDMTX domain-containing protein n=1 Tax=Pantoea cypripedii TaxID=55209 RepID=A0A6B9G3H9_PANCY|nr:hypothetical protein [Pantoea cypripedii]QGY32161.1 hypothetical protein CUN67_24520 [Pantoea cypripedii]